jgi:hypothetical protein
MRFLLIIAIVFPIQCFSQQNLIPNWSFEQRRIDVWGDTICSLGNSSIYHTEYWGNSEGSVDYLHECHNANNPTYGVPSNVFGNQYAFDGVAYAHFVSYAYFQMNFGTNVREMVWLELPDSLKSGQGYLFRFKISLADSAMYATNKIGGLFTDFDTRYLNDEEFFQFQPQVESSSEILGDKDGWMNVEGQFIAHGGEKYLTIGTFHSDEDLLVQQQRPLYYADWYGYFGSGHYYLDAVELYEDNSIGVNEYGNRDLKVYPNPTNDHLRIEVGDAFKNGTYNIFNSYGSIVANGRIEAGSYFEYTLEQSTGMYIIQFLGSHGVTGSAKVVKE